MLALSGQERLTFAEASLVQAKPARSKTKVVWTRPARSDNELVWKRQTKSKAGLVRIVQANKANKEQS